MTTDRFLADRRGVSTTVSFVLATGITVVLVAGLLVSMSAVMEGQEARAVDNELATVAEGIAVDVEEVTRLSETLEAGDSLAMRIEAPNRIAGQPYTVTIDTSGDPTLVVETRDRSREVELVGPDVVQSGSVTGGTIWIVADDEGVEIRGERP